MSNLGSRLPHLPDLSGMSITAAALHGPHNDVGQIAKPAAASGRTKSWHILRSKNNAKVIRFPIRWKNIAPRIPLCRIRRLEFSLQYSSSAITKPDLVPEFGANSSAIGHPKAQTSSPALVN